MGFAGTARNLTTEVEISFLTGLPMLGVGVVKTRFYVLSVDVVFIKDLLDGHAPSECSEAPFDGDTRPGDHRPPPRTEVRTRTMQILFRHIVFSYRDFMEVARLKPRPSGRGGCQQSTRAVAWGTRDDSAHRECPKTGAIYEYAAGAR